MQDGQVPVNPYPRWDYFPRNVRPPEWVEPFVAEVRAIEPRISTVEQGTGLPIASATVASPLRCPFSHVALTSFQRSMLASVCLCPSAGFC